jgi:hypothetical protein
MEATTDEGRTTVKGATVRRITRTAGAGGHVTYVVDIRTPAGTARTCTFSGNLFGGPVLLSSECADGRTRIAEIEQPREFGEFAIEHWVHGFFRNWQLAVVRHPILVDDGDGS